MLKTLLQQDKLNLGHDWDTCRQAPAFPSTHTSCLCVSSSWDSSKPCFFFSIWIVLLPGQRQWQLFPQQIAQVLLVGCQCQVNSSRQCCSRWLGLTFPCVILQGQGFSLFPWLAWNRSAEGGWGLLCWMKDGIFAVPWAGDEHTFFLWVFTAPPGLEGTLGAKKNTALTLFQITLEKNKNYSQHHLSLEQEVFFRVKFLNHLLAF